MSDTKAFSFDIEDSETGINRFGFSVSKIWKIIMHFMKGLEVLFM